MRGANSRRINHVGGLCGKPPFWPNTCINSGNGRSNGFPGIDSPPQNWGTGLKWCNKEGVPGGSPYCFLWAYDFDLSRSYPPTNRSAIDRFSLYREGFCQKQRWSVAQSLG